MIDNLPLAFDIQGRLCRGMGSPLYGDLLQRCAEELERRDLSSPLVRLLDDWHGDLKRDFLPLRLLGGVHSLVLSGDAPGLAAHYPSVGGTPKFPAAWLEWLSLIDQFEVRLRDGLGQAPQTNEVARSCSLIGGFLTVAERFGHPLRLCEIGASAGLNQHFDRHRYELGEHRWGNTEAPLTLSCEWKGDVPPLTAPLSVATRSACDRAPVDVSKEADRIRLMAYFWADQPARLDRLRAAIEVALRDPVPIAQAHAVDWLASELEKNAPERQTTVLFHSSFWSYLDDSERDAIRGHVARAAESASERSPFAWLRVEDAGPRVAIDLSYWPGEVERRLGYASPHGTWVEWEG